MVYNTKLSPVAFLKSKQQLGNLADKIKKHFSYRIRTDQPVLSYLNYIHFECPETIGENDISCILLTFSCLVPMLSVLKIYNKQSSKCV